MEPPGRPLSGSKSLRSAAVASLNQWARQWLPEASFSEAPPHTSPRVTRSYADPSTEACDADAGDTEELTMSERPRALDDAWTTFMSSVQKPELAILSTLGSAPTKTGIDSAHTRRFSRFTRPSNFHGAQSPLIANAPRSYTELRVRMMTTLSKSRAIVTVQWVAGAPSENNARGDGNCVVSPNAQQRRVRVLASAQQTFARVCLAALHVAPSLPH